MVKLFHTETGPSEQRPASRRAGGPPDPRALMLDHYHQHLQVSTSRNGRPYTEKTISGYMRCVRMPAAWLDKQGLPGDLTPACDPAVLNRFLRDYLGHDVNGASFVQRNLRNLFVWLEVETDTTSPFRSRDLNTYTARQHKPKTLDGEFIERILGTCKGGTFTDVRDLAIIRLFMEGMRAGEVPAMAPDDVPPLNHPILRVAPSKGELAYATDSGRRILLEDDTALALQRWTRKRAEHPLAKTTLRNTLWLGRGSVSPLSYRRAVGRMLERRSRTVLEPEGLDGHASPHMFRHTFAHVFRANGGSLDDLTQHMGWSSYEMAQRYGKDLAEDRAIRAKREMSRTHRMY
jgi:integrase/recombinase XerD